MESRSSKFLILAGLVVLTFLAYVPSIQGGYIWDDDKYVTENETLLSGEGLRRIWFEPKSIPQYYPLVHTTYWLEYRVWGLDPTGFHVVNVALHAAAAILVWALLRRLSVPGALLAAAIFAVHPVHVESVAWITERKNVLSGACYLGAMLAYFQFAPPVEPDAPPSRRGGWYVLALLLFLFALLSKTVTSTMPAAILLIYWWKRGRLSWRDVVPLLPMFVLGIVLGLHTSHLERVHVGAQGPDWDFTAAERGLIAGRALWFYAGKVLWPHPLIFIYPRWDIDSAVWWQYLFPVAAVLLVVALSLLRKRLGRGPFTAACFFGGSLLPASGIFNVYPMLYSFVADHFQYLASLGPIVLVGAFLARFGDRLPKAAAMAGAAALVTVLSVLTWVQGRQYESEETLYRATIAANPGAWMAHGNLGSVLAEQGRMDEALEHLENAVEVFPEYGGAHLNLGLAYALRRDLGLAERHFLAAVEYSPWLVDAHFGLGQLYFGQRRYVRAEESLTRALSIRPDDPRTLTYLGCVHGKRGNLPRAKQFFLEALQLDPDYAEASFYLGQLEEMAE